MKYGFTIGGGSGGSPIDVVSAVIKSEGDSFEVAVAPVVAVVLLVVVVVAGVVSVVVVRAVVDAVVVAWAVNDAVVIGSCCD